MARKTKKIEIEHIEYHLPIGKLNTISGKIQKTLSNLNLNNVHIEQKKGDL